MDWLLSTEIGQIVLLAATLVAAQFIIKAFLTSLIRRAVRSHKFESKEEERKREDTLVNIIGTALAIFLWIIGIVGLLAILHVNIAGLVTGAGLIGLVVALGGQSAIKDFVAGVFILLENQYRVGDVVTIGGFSGVVEKITLRITQLRDLDGHLHTVPNGSVDIITNRTFEWSNVNMNIGVSYDADIDKVARLINQTGAAMATEEDWRDSIIEPIIFLRLNGFGDSSVDVKALGKVRPGMQWRVAGEFRARLKKAFDKNGIEIPFPQRVMHKPGETKPHKK